VVRFMSGLTEDRAIHPVANCLKLYRFPAPERHCPGCFADRLWELAELNSREFAGDFANRRRTVKMFACQSGSDQNPVRADVDVTMQR